MVSVRRGVTRWVLAAVCSVPLAAQSPVPQFKVAVDYVHVDVAVTDGSGAFVRDLKANDFEIYEDGRLQQVASFAFIEAPRPEPAAPTGKHSLPAAESDVVTNDVEAAGRVYVLVLDDLHVDALRSGRVKQAAREFVEQHLGSRDLAAVIHTSGRADANQDFTSRRSLLLAAIDKFTGRKLRSRVLEALDAYQQRSSSGSRADVRLERATDPRDAERADQAQRTLKTLANLADVLTRTPGRRKTVLLISEGIDYPLQEGVTQTESGLTAFTSSYAPEVLRNLKQAVGAAARANLNIYSLDPRGVATTGADTIEVSSFPENPQLGLTPEAFQQDLRDAQASLKTLSEETGGIASVSSNDFAAVFDRIVSDSGTYYMLGYQSSNRRADGTFRRIEVRVKRAGVQIRSRSGYRAAETSKRDPQLLPAAVEPSAVLRDALNAPLPVATLPLTMFAAPFRGSTQESVAVGIEMDARRFGFGQKDGLFTDKVEVALIALDAQGKFKVGDRQTVQLQLKPETHAAVQARGLRVFFRLNLPPGRYQLRAAATEAGSGATGTMFYDLQIPEFHKVPLAISGLAIASTRTASVPTPRLDPVFQASLPSPPTVARTFSPDETLTVLFEVYRRGPSGAAGVDLTTTVRDEAGAVRFKSDELVTTDKVTGGEAGFGYTVPIPLNAMPPGPYVLRVEARPRSSSEQAVAREVPFAIAAAVR